MAAAADRPIIVKKVKKASHKHHGGAWKIAYADFVTAMMAFFMLLWLISMTTPEQKVGLADYFAPPNVIASQSGAGGLLGGQAVDDKGAEKHGAEIDGKKDVTQAATAKEGMVGKQESVKQADPINDAKSNQERAFESAAASIKQAWQADPDVTNVIDNLRIDKTPEGMDVTIMDAKGMRMFPEGSKFPIEPARKALVAMAPILQRLGSQVRISGHTAAGVQYDNPAYGAWELSSDRANVVRGILGESGLSDDSVNSVVGRGSAEPFFVEDPYLSANERVTVTVLYTAPAVPPGMKP